MVNHSVSKLRRLEINRWLLPRGYRLCSVCFGIFPLSSYYSRPSRNGRTHIPTGGIKYVPQCKPCYNDFYGSRRPRPSSSRAYRLRKEYGLTLDDYDLLLSSQGGRCAICSRSPVEIYPEGHHMCLLVVDHCHAENRVRGLLCHMCNIAIGNFNDDPNILHRAADYLQSHGKVLQRRAL